MRSLVGTAQPGRMRRAAAGLAAMLVLAGYIIGLPVLLWQVGGNPLPTRVPGVEEVLATLARPDDGSLLRQVMVVAGWLAWAGFTSTVALEAADRVAGRWLPTPPGLRAQRRLAGALIGAVAAILATPISGTGSQAQPLPAAATSTLDPEHDPLHEASRTTIPSPDQTLHLVERGEAMLDLQDAYGVPWQRIASANYGHPQPDGRTLQPGQTRIYPGWQLRIPTANLEAPPHLGATPIAREHDDLPEHPHAHLVYQVVHGDWMWQIAERYLGDPQRYPEIAELNSQYADRRGIHPDGHQLIYPDYILPGWQLTLPSDAEDRGPRAHASGELLPSEQDDDQQRPDPPTGTPNPPPAPAPPPTPPATSPPAHPSTPPSPDVAPSPGLGDDGVVTVPTAPASGSPQPKPASPPQQTADRKSVV